MTRKVLALISLLLMLTVPALAQGAPASPAAKADYSEEPFVVERYQTSVRFEKDGTSRRTTDVRVKVQSELGVEQWGQVVIGYNSANEKLDVTSLRVLKKDGSVVTAGAEAAQDMTAQVARDAPMYTDYREKHLTVPGLRPGDTLEYSYVTTVTTPLAPNQFWFSYEFMRVPITLNEMVEVSVPQGVALQLKTNPGFDPRVSDEDGRRVYRWEHSNLVRKTQEERRKDRLERWRKQVPPDIQLSTFRSWAEVGEWYRGLERGRVQPSETVRAKAQELVAGRKTEIEKVEAIYNFVSQNFRYVSLSFGVGRYQPHPAADILANRYGDCKDKHTLLASLLDAVGIPANAALINSSRRLDPDLPSPAQFDHVITVVPLKGGEVWLDSTPEIAPFRVISYNLRGKQALVVPLEGTSRLVTVPEAIPVGNWHKMEIDASVSPLGKLTAHVHETLRGDDEIYYRSAFRGTPQPYWKDMIQTLTGYRGEISDIQAGPVGDTSQPFEVSYTVSIPNLISISSKHPEMDMPVPYMLSVPDPPTADDDTSIPQQIPSAPSTMTFRVRLEFPPQYTVVAPVPITVKRDYGSYTSTYKLEKNVLIVERVLATTMRELPGTRAKDYYAFARAVRADQEQNVSLDRTGTAAEASAVPKGAKIEELIETGAQALRNDDVTTALAVFEAATQTEPKNWRGWAGLGSAYIAQQRYRDAVEAFKKVIEIDPYSEFAYSSLATSYVLDRNFPEAEKAFQQQLEVTPLDAGALRGLAGVFIEERKFADALPPLEKAASLQPRDAATQTLLGQCYLETGQQDKAVAALNRAVDISPEPGTWNDVAYMFAEHDLQLDRAQQYAESAVASVSAELRNVDLNNVSMREIGRVGSLAAYWDTLGWVHFHKGDLATAEKFIRAALPLTSSGEVLDHWGEILEKKGDKEGALRYYALATAVRRSYPEARPRLVRLAGGEKEADLWKQKVAPEADRRYSLDIPDPSGVAGTADFLLLIAPGSRIETAKFLGGDPALKNFGAAIEATPHGYYFPDGTPTKLLGRATVTCKPGVTKCELRVLRPEETTSVN
jgi:tetratricopeptide (TPR) repeat protein